MNNIIWTDKDCKISQYFTVGEALYLPSWQIYHIPSDVEKENILRMAGKMDLIRAYIDMPIRVHVWIRPGKVNRPGKYMGLDYNAFVKGAPRSAHKVGLAVDWSAPGWKCDDIRAKLLPKLEEFGIRMEDKPRSNWIHCDLYEPGPGGRFFKP